MRNTTTHPHPKHLLEAQHNKKAKQVPTEPLAELTPQEQAKLEWGKEIRILQNMITRDINTFMQLKIKGQKLVGDKQSGVTKELLQALESGLKSLQAQGESIYEVHVEGSSQEITTFQADTFSKQVTKAKEVMNSLGDLKARGQRIIGK